MNQGSESSKLAESPPKTKAKRPRGTVHMLVERCKACGNCVAFCPKEMLSMSEEYNERGYHFPRVDKPEECTGCRLCELLCGEFAIFVVVHKPDKPAREEGE